MDRRGGAAGEAVALPMAMPTAIKTAPAAARTHRRSADPVLREGARGPSVTRLQRLLQKRGVSPGPIDGIFGPKTEAAVKRFQQKHQLAADGVAGPRTWSRLEQQPTSAAAQPK